MRAAILGLVLVGAAWAFAPIGFNPTDDGLIVAQSSRILHGDAPHLEITSPRPLGSPLLHVVDVVLPTPVLFTSRVIVLLELLVVAVLSVRLLRSSPIGRWGATELALTVVAFVVNLHTFPLMSWHTVDGLLLGMVALAAVQRGAERSSLRWIALGAFVAGCAPLVKQSFAPVPLLVAAWACWRHHLAKRGEGAGSVGWLRFGAALLPAVLPGAAYLLWVARTSSIAGATDQMSAASSVETTAGLELSVSLKLVGLLVAVVLLVVVAQRQRAGASSGPEGPLPAPLRLAVGATSVVLICLALAAVGSGELLGGGTWSATLWWLALFSALLWSGLSEDLDLAGLAVPALGWMASLSWGYPVTTLMAGSLLVVVLVRAGQALGAVRVDELGSSGRRVPVLGAVALAVALVALSVDARRTTVYRDVAAADQHADLGAVFDGARGVRTNQTTAAYLGQVRDCLAAHPARRLAVLPDNPVVPLLVDRTNPFPLDWWYPLEIVADRGRILEAVAEVDRKGDYLVLFQTVSAADLATSGSLPPAAADARLFDYRRGMVADVFDALTGRVVVCGSFVARYSPG